MAVIVATSSGSVIVGESGSVPLAEGVIGSTTPAITHQVKSQVDVASGTASGALLPAGMTTILFVHLRFFDTTDDTPINVASVTVNAVVIPNVQELLWTSKEIASGLTALSFTTNAGNPVRGEFIIGGV